jgi:hypothetical protein
MLHDSHVVWGTDGDEDQRDTDDLDDTVSDDLVEVDTEIDVSDVKKTPWRRWRGGELSLTTVWLSMSSRGRIRRIRGEERLWIRIVFVEELPSSLGCVQREAEPTFDRALPRVGAQRSGRERGHSRVESRQKR